MQLESTPPALRRTARLVLVLAFLALVSSSAAGTATRPGVSLIIKTQTNPYFVSMKQAAQDAAKKSGAHLSVAVRPGGRRHPVADQRDRHRHRPGRQGHPDHLQRTGVNAALRQAKDYGLFVIALDTPLDPAKTADVTYATNNFQAGKLIGQYAAARARRQDGRDRDARPLRRPGRLRRHRPRPRLPHRHGHRSGQQDARTPRRRRTGTYTGGKGGSYTIACHQATQGAVDGGRKAMEQCLSRNPDINVVYTINEPAGEGAYAALKADNHQDKTFIVSIDGSCQGMADVENGHLRRRRDPVPRQDGAARRRRDREDRRGPAGAVASARARTTWTPAPSSSRPSRCPGSTARPRPTARRRAGARRADDSGPAEEHTVSNDTSQTAETPASAEDLRPYAAHARAADPAPPARQPGAEPADRADRGRDRVRHLRRQLPAARRRCPCSCSRWRSSARSPSDRR